MISQNLSPRSRNPSAKCQVGWESGSQVPGFFPSLLGLLILCVVAVLAVLHVHIAGIYLPSVFTNFLMHIVSDEGGGGGKYVRFVLEKSPQFSIFIGSFSHTMMIKRAILICAIRTKLATCSRQKMPVLSYSSLLGIKIASFIFIVADQDCYFFLLSKIKIAFYPYCCGWKKPVLLFFSQIKNASFILIIADLNYQFYPYCHRSRLIVLSSMSKIKIASFFPFCCVWKILICDN